MPKSIQSQALDHYGIKPQAMQTCEEMAELSVLLHHYRRERHVPYLRILEEIADVQIMLDQMKLYFERYSSGTVKEYKIAKLQRLEQRMREDKKP